ncbi:MAG: hypothetical protein IT355_13965 [Gemmatimonadaceae bacterium]|nr:hypothetical protein [Gemmatimonadaceae bacterium]
MRRLFFLGIAFALQSAAVVAQARSFTSPLSLRSDDPRLVGAFTWARAQATAYAVDGDAVGPWFEAALPGRAAFCMRDVAHQAVGAHALGMQVHLRNMLGRFVASISAERDWAGYWEIDRHGQPAHADYRNDRDFWYNLPANFDLLDASWRMYLWSGNRDYVTDGAFLHFYDRTVTEYVARWQLGPESVMTRPRMMNAPTANDPDARFSGNRGIPGYNEETDDFTVGLDLLAAQYAGFAAYARIREVRGDLAGARTWLAKAGEVKALVNGRWWDERTRTFHDFLSTSQVLGHRGPNAWNSAALYWPVAAEGPQTLGALEALREQVRTSPPAPIEEQSHHPEVLYRYGAATEAYAELLSLSAGSRARREYPEVSFSVVGAIVTGVMGIGVDPVVPGHETELLRYFDNPAIMTLAQLPPAASFVELQHLGVRGNDVTVRHEGRRSTAFTNHRGPALVWQAAFAGRHTTLQVNGASVKATTMLLPAGREVSVARVVVAPGTTGRVSVGR